MFISFVKIADPSILDNYVFYFVGTNITILYVKKILTLLPDKSIFYEQNRSKCLKSNYAAILVQ